MTQDDARNDAPHEAPDETVGTAGSREQVAPSTPTRSRALLPLTEASAELGRISLVDTSLTQVLGRVATFAQASIPGADQVSITLIDAGRPSTVAFTGDLAVQLDERQYQDGFGPCMDAARKGGTIPLLHLAQEQRYPGFASAARRAGVTGTLSVGMPVPSGPVGGLNIYRLGGAGGEELDEESVRVAEAFAGYAAVAVANAGLLHSTRRVAEQLREAMASRAGIEQAKGVLVARTGCSPDEAFAQLVQDSRRQNRKVAVLAAELLAQAQQGETGSSGRTATSVPVSHTSNVHDRRLP